MSSQMVRLLQILAKLPRYPKNITTKVIKETFDNQKFEVTLRTIQRDLLTLETAFPNRIGSQKCHDKTVRWFWKKDAPVLNLSGLTINQALSLKLLEKYLSPLFPKVTMDDLELFFDEAQRTLNFGDENPLVDWPKKIAIVQPTQPLLVPEIDPEIQHIVSEALLTDHQLYIKYRRSNGVENSYQLKPLGLVLRNGSTYLIATKANNEDQRIFALHRILQAEQLDAPAKRPVDFDLQRFIDEGHMGFDLTGGGSYQPIKLKAIFDGITANHLSESRLSEDQVIKKLDNKHFEITATVQETEQLFWWLLSFGFRAEVLEPPALRAKMANSVKVLAEKYQTDKISQPNTRKRCLKT